MHLLLHFTQIVIQVVIYLTQLYPEHPYILILLVKMHLTGYAMWATQMREHIQQRDHAIQVNVSGDSKYDTILQSSE